MSNKSLLPIFCLFLLAGCASTNSQKEAINEPRTVGVAEYLDFLDSLTVAVNEGVPRELTIAEHNQFVQTTEQLRRLLGGVDHVEQLNLRRRVEIFNLHQELDGLVQGDRENYLVCDLEAPLGSNITRTQCLKAGDYTRRRERMLEQFRSLQRPGPMPSGGA